jgi:lipopolysaccharide export system protein LptA
LRNREAARYARWSAMAAGLIVLAVAGAYIYRAAQRARARRDMPAAVPASVEQQSAAFTYKSVDQGRTLFTLRASEVTRYKDHNRAQLRDVWITIYGRDGNQNDDIHTRECSYDPQTGGARCEGSVQIDIAAAGEKNSATAKPGPGLELVTSDLLFDRETGNASTTAPVKFTFPGGSGSGVGVDYSTRDATVRVQRAIRFQLAASDKTGGLPVSASGSSLEIHRMDRRVVLNGPVNVQQGERVLSTQKITADFDASNRVRQVLIDGHPQIHANERGSAITVSAAQFQGVLNPAGWIERVIANGNVQATRQLKGGAERFSANHVEFAMIPQRNLVQNMTATGEVMAQSQQSGEVDTLRADALRVTFFAPEAASHLGAKAAPSDIARQQIESAETLSPAAIQMSKGAEKTTVSAEKFVAQAGPDGRVRKLLGHGGVTIRRESSAAVAQIVSAPELTAELGSRGEWERVEETGGVQMRQGERQAMASSARIDRVTDAIRLEGSPVVMDGQSRTTASRMSFNQKSGELEADGVVSTYAPDGKQDAISLGSGAAHISAERLTGSANSGHVTYSGNVRLWQGESVLEADRIDLWRNEKRMQASGNVVAVFPQSAGPAVPSTPDFAGVGKKSAKESGPTLWKIHAPLLTYWGDQNRAHLEGGVLASSDQGTLHSRTLDIYLRQSPVTPPIPASTAGSASKAPGPQERIPELESFGAGQLDRVVARGGVVVEQGDRHGMAEQAEYTASDGKFVLSGGQPTVTDGSNNSATGSSLTFYVASDTILIDSREGSRTLTKHRVEK